MEYQIQNVEYFTQRDNKIFASISCFPTSLAMCINYCLTQAGLNKSAVGCAPENQLEDYLNMILDDNETKQWMIKNQGRLGMWIWQYKRRTLYAVESYIFNRLMNSLGYKSTESYNAGYQTVCNLLKQNELPMVIGGNFSSVSSVGGHMVNLVGYNSIGLKEFIVNDPYGNALTGYKDDKGEYVRYPSKFFEKSKGEIYCLVISKI